MSARYYGRVQGHDQYVEGTKEEVLEWAWRMWANREFILVMWGDSLHPTNTSAEGL